MDIEGGTVYSIFFQGAVFTQNLDTAMRVYKRLDASAVMVNDHTACRIGR